MAVVESGSFQAAGERLNVAKSVVSRRINLLEQSLNTRLLNRTTRSQSLTDEGQQFYQRSVQILADLEDAEIQSSQDSEDIRGNLKLAAPLSFGLSHLSKAITDFMCEHPAIELNMDLNDRTLNLVEDGFDMAVRIGELEDSTLIARRIGISRFLTCASPDYLEKYGNPNTPEELNKHIGLQYSNSTYKRHWQFLSDDGQLHQGLPQIRIRANNGEALVEAALAGLGISRSPTFICYKYIESGDLVPILTDYQIPSMGIYAVYPPGRMMPHRVKVFTDFLSDRYGEHPYWDDCLLQ